MNQPIINPPHPGKLELIDRFAASLDRPWRFADLGGVWAVHGVYSVHAAAKHNCSGGCLVDTHPTALTLEKAAGFPQLQIIKGNFGTAEVAERIGPVDAVFLFDVLLHQVAPNWDEILDLYTPHTRAFLIFNQQFLSPATVRLLDLGEDEFFRNVPHDRNHPTYRDLFSRLDEIHPDHGRPWRDVHHIWQWGITDHDLHAHLSKRGFRLEFFRSWGQVLHLKKFENHACIYVKP